MIVESSVKHHIPQLNHNTYTQDSINKNTPHLLEIVQPLSRIWNITFQELFLTWDSDGQQFHHYQQNEQLLVASSHWTTRKKDNNMSCRKSRSWLGICTNVAGVKRVNEIFFLLFNDLRRQVTARFVDSGEIVDHHCLNCPSIISNENRRHVAAVMNYMMITAN
jgi:hypothetical protein